MHDSEQLGNLFCFRFSFLSSFVYVVQYCGVFSCLRLFRSCNIVVSFDVLMLCQCFLLHIVVGLILFEDQFVRLCLVLFVVYVLNLCVLCLLFHWNGFLLYVVVY